MPPTRLEQQIVDLTQSFALEVFTAIRAGLDDLFALDVGSARPKRGRPRVHAPVHVARTSEEQARELLQSKGFILRRSPEELQKVAEEIIAIVKANPGGIRAEAIKDKMGFTKGRAKTKVFAKPLSLALASKKIKKRGQRRATLYFAA